MITNEISILESAAESLREARASQKPIAPITQTYGIEGIQNAYAIAAINTNYRVENGARIVGKKVGLTSLSVQQQLGVDQPDLGILFDDMEYLDGDVIPTKRLIQPKAEAEIAFIVGRDMKRATLSWGEFLASLTFALPAIEIADSAIENWNLSLVDTVADNASCGAYVLGNQPIAMGQLSLAEIGMQMEKNGSTVSIGTGAACLAHPLRAAYWMAGMIAKQGEGLREGEIILSGALGPMVSVKAGDHIQARFGALGAVSCRLI